MAGLQIAPGSELADRSQGRGSGLSWLDYFLFFLVAATPALFALATFDPAGSRSAPPGFLRMFSLPVVVIEIGFVVIAMRRGFEPLRMMATTPRWIQAAVLALILIAFFTALFVAPDQQVAVIRTSTTAIHLLFGLAAAHLLSARWFGLRPLLWPYILAGTCAYLLILAILVATVSDPLQFHWVRLGLGVTHVRQTGFYSIVGAGAALGLAATAARGRRYWGAVAAASLLLALSFWSGTRGSIVAVAAAFIVGATFLPPLRSKRALLAVGVSFIAGACLSLLHTVPHHAYGLFRISNSVSEASADYVASGRIATWEGTWRGVLQRPLFGHGESQFRDLVPEALGSYNHPHNIVLQILFQWGFAGALCFFALGAALCWRAYEQAKRDADSVPAFLVVIGLLVMSLYEGSLYHPYPIMLVALGLAFLLTARSKKPFQAG